MNKEFTRLMVKMGVPHTRVEANKTNANWFLRQGIAYHNHKHYLRARAVALEIANDSRIS